ncbi:MAG: translation initiation factor IF-2 [Rhizobiales bacterium]|nr:translation initiation factor IF-2 [Hyphomicrobiales bacterium]NRB15242.1 translation initiation factor IF-2 [Hyphomicrobiales bacterium]
MTDRDNSNFDDGGRKKLSLKVGGDAGASRGAGAAGRTVEVVKKRKKIFVPNKPAARTFNKPTSNKPSGSNNRGRQGSGKGAPSGGLSTSEQEARNRALAFARANAAKDDARRKADEERRAADTAAKRAKRAAEEADTLARSTAKAEKEAAITAAAAAPTAAARTDDARPTERQAGPNATRKGEERTRSPQRRDGSRPDARPTARPGARPTPRPGDRSARPQAARPARSVTGAAESTETSKTPRRTFGADAKKATRPDQNRNAPSRKGMTPERNRGRLTLSNALTSDSPRERSLASMKRRQKRVLAQQRGIQTPREKVSREVTIPDVITVQELANRMSERAVDVIKILMQQGQMVKASDNIDTEMAELIVEEMGHTAKRVSEADVEEDFITAEENEDLLVKRAPIVTVMGHVDHGKTSLLDAFRNADVVDGEAGGITQHIGAYQVTTDDGELITFLDTPGHAAFTEMRARGANATDIVILVVAADDGVMPQTIEAINHAKAAGVPIIVAINKMDKPTADPSRVRNELLQHEVFVESLGGDILEVEVSATERTNLDKLLEAILLQAELVDMKANPDRPADGVVVEAKLDRGRGPVATMLVQNGTIKIGNIIVAGTTYGKVRALIDDHDKNIAKAGPSMPVEVLGLDTAPNAGEPFAVVATEARARELVDYRINKARDLTSIVDNSGITSLETMMASLKASEMKEFNILLKGDVQGSVEAILGALGKLGNDEVKARIIHSGVGAINETDVQLAAASNAIIMAFNVRANPQAKEQAAQHGNEIRYYSIIYNLIDDVRDAMSGMLDPTLKENFIGYAKILEIFDISKLGKIGGCNVTEGVVRRGSSVRLLRDNVVIHEGKLSTLRRFKDEVKEAAVGQECGMGFENYHDLKVNDVIECFEIEVIQNKLEA